MTLSTNSYVDLPPFSPHLAPKLCGEQSWLELDCHCTFSNPWQLTINVHSSHLVRLLIYIVPNGTTYYLSQSTTHVKNGQCSILHPHCVVMPPLLIKYQRVDSDNKTSYSENC